MSNINELVLQEYVSWGQDDSLVNGINNGINAAGRGIWNYGVKPVGNFAWNYGIKGPTNLAWNYGVKPAGNFAWNYGVKPAGNFAWNYGVKPAGSLAWGVTKPVLKGAAYGAAGLAGAGLLGKAIASTDIGNAAIGGMVGTGARVIGGALADTAFNSGINGAVSGAIGSSIPFVGAALGAYQQHRINELNDAYDRARGITPTSNPIINGIKIAASAALSSIPFAGGLTNFLQGIRLANAKRRLEDVNSVNAYNQQRYGAGAPQ